MQKVQRASSSVMVNDNLRSGPFLASLICSLMSSLAKIGPDQKVSQEFRLVGQILADQIRDLIGC